MRLGAGCAPAPSSAPEAAPPTAAPAAKRPAPSRAAVRQKKKQREEAEQMEWELDEREGGFQRGLPKEEAQKLRAKQRRQRMLAREEMGEGRQLFSIPCTLATLLHSGHAPWLLPAIEELVRAYTRVGYDVRALVQFCLTRLAERGAPMPKLDHDFYVHAFQCVTRLGSTSDPDPWQHATSLDRCLLSAAAAELLAEGCLAQPLVDRSGCRHPLYSLATSAAAEVSTHTRTQLRPRLSAWLGMVLGEAAGLSSTHRTRVVRCCIGALMAGQRRPEGWNGNKFAFLLPAQRQLVERVLDGIWQRWRHVLPIKAKLKGPKWVDFIAWGHAMQTDVEAWVHACAVHDLAATALQPPPAAVQPGAGQAAAAAAQPAGPPPQLPFHLSLAMQARAAAVEASAAAAQAEPVAVAARAAADGALEKFPQAGSSGSPPGCHCEHGSARRRRRSGFCGARCWNGTPSSDPSGWWSSGDVGRSVCCNARSTSPRRVCSRRFSSSIGGISSSAESGRSRHNIPPRGGCRICGSAGCGSIPCGSGGPTCRRRPTAWCSSTPSVGAHEAAAAGCSRGDSR